MNPTILFFFKAPKKSAVFKIGCHLIKLGVLFLVTRSQSVLLLKHGY